MAEDKINLHHLYAQTGHYPGEENNFGVTPLSSHAKDTGKTPVPDKHLHDHMRGAKPPIRGNQANPDHGKMK